jgi:hypothetical protein
MVQFDLTPIDSEVFAITQILVIVCALFLMGLSIRAWKNTGVRKIIYLIIAFSLFAVQHVINYVDQTEVDFISDELRYVVFAVIQVVIMGMFVLAILKK